jgi:hypothetical protein
MNKNIVDFLFTFAIIYLYSNVLIKFHNDYYHHYYNSDNSNFFPIVSILVLSLFCSFIIILMQNI